VSEWVRTLRGVAGMLRRPARSHSQFGEDVFVRKFFQGRRTGTWLDIGAFHPTIASNTALLRRAGWTGINVDADAVKMRLFGWFRRSEVNICAAVAGAGNRRAVLDRASAASYGSMDSVTLTDDGPGLPTRTVADILDEVRPASVEFVSIDVEGLEAEILSAYPFDRYPADLFCVEVLDMTLDGVRASPVVPIFEAHGYQVVGWFPPSVFFARHPLRLGDD
jgi:FkbM family methyltransferase